MKILKLEAQNVMKLKAVEIVPDGSAVVIGGFNGNGKSSVLNAIAFAIGGKELMCEEPVRRGEKTARVRCDLGELIVTRTFSATGGTTLKVTTANGDIKPSPQTVLDNLMGALSFDPLDFARKPKEQAAILRKLIGLDTTAIDTERAKFYDDRATQNRKLRDLKGQSFEEFPDAPAEEVSVKELSAKLKIANTHNERIRATNKAIEECDKSIERYTRLLKDAQDARLVAVAHLDGLKTTASGPVDDNGMMDSDGIQSMIEEADDTNRKVRANVAAKKLRDDIGAVESNVIFLNSRIEKCDREKADALRAAAFPIEGLGISETGVTMNGIPFSQASSAEQLRASFAIGLAMNPGLRVVLIRDGSLLDEQSLRMVAEMAEKADAQVWIERVGQCPECSVIIEDGEVANAIKIVPDESVPDGELYAIVDGKVVAKMMGVNSNE